MEVNTWCESAFRQVRASLGNCQVAIMSSVVIIVGVEEGLSAS
jgi:hypothetical protein